ncbi:MAG: M48 family metallopeptidase [Planctomycetes bacterium]|nr:M48 family metallopeptidase [Planctomycetota bacterium]MCP4772245.1 M48 family metallopeptidase [Planctomycetota bacterium]MCP4861301.1 M48 family metallopeptidase [Planctomycetota bacterium]
MKFVPRQLGDAADNSKGGKEGWRSRLKGILSAAIILSIFYVILGFIADISVNLVSEESESEWFAWVDDVVLVGAQEPSPELQAIFDQLIADSDLRPFEYRLFVLVDPMPNAFALPGGTVTVTTGLLDLVETEIGRAMVLSHELGHLEHRHGLKRLGRSLLLAVGMSMVGLDSSALLKQSSFLAEMKHSRSQEEESDTFGLNLIYAKYGTTEGAFEFFEDIHLLEGEDGTSLVEGVQSWAHTHPLTENRLTNLRRQAVELER